MKEIENIARAWPRLLLVLGLLFFGVACIGSRSLPVETLFIGPGLMAIAVLMNEQNRRAARGDKRDSAAS